MILTGSRALSFYCEIDCSDSDWDVIASEEELQKIGLSFSGKDSIKIPCKDSDNHIEFINSLVLENYSITKNNGLELETVNILYNNRMLECYICPLVWLYIQKRSHIHRPIKFARHIRQLQIIKEQLIKNGQFPLSKEYQKTLDRRIYITKKKYPDRVPSLNKSNEDFFDDKVTKYYIHDDIHKVMAYYDEPIYEKLKIDKSLAKCEKELWTNLSHGDKIKYVQEECFVIAVERFVIPKIKTNQRYMPDHMSFNKALEKVCTTLTSGWFRDFAIDNWEEIRRFEVDFYSKLLNSIESGELV